MPCKQNSPGHIAQLRAAAMRTDERRRNGEGFIYAAELVGADVVKIGHSLKPTERVRHVGTWAFKKANLLAVSPGTITQERALHKTLREFCRVDFPGHEFYPRSILDHAALPAALRLSAPSVIRAATKGRAA